MNTELARINADGTCQYDWPLIEATAAKWEPFCTDYIIGLSKLLMGIRDAPKQSEPVATLTVRDDMGADIKFRQALTLLPGQTFALYTHNAPEAKQEPLTAEQYTALAHRIASKYAHRSDPKYIAYTFLPHTLEQFVRVIEAAHGIKGGA